MDSFGLFSSKKNILIFGFGISGQAVYNFLKSRGHNIYTFDEQISNTPNRMAQIDYSKLDIIIKSPSIPCMEHNIHPILKEAKNNNIEILSSFDVFRIHNPTTRLIGITGTNGKSTTTALVYHILKEAKFSVTMGGNIGVPYFSLPKSEFCVLEMSSYEIESSKYLDFEIGCVINIEPDHLSFHGSFENYVNSKHKLLEHSKTKIISYEDQNSIMKYKSQDSIIVSTNHIPSVNYFIYEGTLISDEKAEIDLANLPELRGGHNHQNILFAWAICRKLGIHPKEISRSINSFKALPHRMNSVTKIGNVLFVNDSKATNPGSAARALATFVGYEIFWLVGGRSKKTDPLIYVSNFLKNVHKIYLFGESEEEFENIFSKLVKTVRCQNLENAVNIAYKEAKNEVGPAVILFSPMCASFDQFKNFEQRGDVFVEHVLKLKENEK